MRAREISAGEIEQLKQLEKKLRGRLESRRLRSVLLRAEHGKSAQEIADLLGIHPRTVEKHHRRYFEEGLNAFAPKPRGAAERGYLSRERESAVLATFESKFSDCVGVHTIRKALEAEIGHSTGETYVYLVLKRHKWKAKRPRPRHPRANPEEQTLFKKTVPGS